MWQLWGTYYWFPIGSPKDAKFGIIEECEDITWLVDEIIEALPQKDKWKLLERHANIVFLPLYLYDHSGITMNTCGHSCRWDSGQVGYIYTDKNVIMETGGMLQNEKGNCVKITDRNWKKAAYQWMEGEVEVYDQYLQGEVYGIITEEYDTDSDDWEEKDSCWGFFSDKCGDELIKDVALNFGVRETLYDVLNDARVA